MKKIILICLILSACQNTPQKYFLDEVYYDKSEKMYLDEFGKPVSGLLQNDEGYENAPKIEILVKKGKVQRFTLSMNDAKIYESVVKGGKSYRKTWSDGILESESVYKGEEFLKFTCYSESGKVTYEYTGKLEKPLECPDEEK